MGTLPEAELAAAAAAEAALAEATAMANEHFARLGRRIDAPTGGARKRQRKKRLRTRFKRQGEEAGVVARRRTPPSRRREFLAYGRGGGVPATRAGSAVTSTSTTLGTLSDYDDWRVLGILARGDSGSALDARRRAHIDRRRARRSSEQSRAMGSRSRATPSRTRTRRRRHRRRPARRLRTRR